LRHWIGCHGKANVVYFDASGFVSHTHRPHGWAIRGTQVFGRIRGNNRKQTNLIMAKRGSEWVAPMLFKASCTHLAVLAWVKQMLLPAQRPNSLLIMDNAPFHNKPKIREILDSHGHTLLPPPRYAPDFNPIEQQFAVLKRLQHFSRLSLDELEHDDFCSNQRFEQKS
jgi:transposase